MAHAQLCPVCGGRGSFKKLDAEGEIKCHGCGGAGWITVFDKPRSFIRKKIVASAKAEKIAKEGTSLQEAIEQLDKGEITFISPIKTDIDGLEDTEGTAGYTDSR
jgi:DnaJ-class molecular chaperone